MPSSFRRSEAALNAEADGVGRLLNGGYLRIYDGSQPATPDGPVTTQVLLAELRFASPAFQPAQDGVVIAHPVTADEGARVSGIPTWFRCVARDGTPVYDGSVGRSASEPDLVLNRATIEQDARVMVGTAIYRAHG